MYPVRFEHPLALLLVPLAVAAFVLWRRRLGGACALAAVLCLTAAIARPLWRSKVSGIARLYVVDVSGSMFLDTGEVLDAIHRSMAELGPSDRAGLVVFGREGAVALPLTDVRRLPGRLPLPTAPPRSDASDIGGAIRLAAGQFGGAGLVRQLVLLTDGRATGGDAAAEAAIAADAGIRLYILPVGPSAVADVRVVRLEAPAHVRVGQPFQVTAQLVATAALEATFALLRDGQPLVTPRREVFEARVARRIVATDRLTRPGTHTYTAHLTVQDRCADNNAASAVVLAEGATRVVYFTTSKRPRALETLLGSAEGLDVTRQDPRQVEQAQHALAAADCVVVDDVAARDMAPSLQRAIRDWVRHAGGGLVVVGGPRSYGPGGYADSPLEEALPVLCKRPEVALVVALDKSGSMAEKVRGRAKIAYAREAVLGAAKRLRGRDAFGLLAFDAQPHVLLPMGPPPSPEALGRVLDAIEPHGPTGLQRTLERALAVVSGASAEVRCVVLVSDGQAEKLDVPGLRRRYREAKVTLSALMTGTDAAAIARLRELAGSGFHEVADLRELPAKFLDALRQAVHERYVLEGTFPVQALGPKELTRGISPAGAARGYVRTAAKQAAVAEWATAKERDPILARWHFGLGRAVAFTSTVGTPWDEALWGSQAATLWAQVVRWAARPARTPGFEAEVAEQGDRLRVTVRAERDGRFLNGLDLTGRLAMPGGEAVDVALPQTAPGEYEAEFPAPRPGTYRLTVVEKGRGQRLSLGVAKNYAREWEAFGIDRAAIETLARQGRGQVIEGLGELRDVATPTAAGWVEAAWVLVAAALALFVAEVALAVLRSRRRL